MELKPAFLSELIVTRDGDKWLLLKPLAYRSNVAGCVLTIPDGFRTDFASVPRLPLAFMLTGDTAHAPAVVHDWLYVTRIVPRAIADRVFKEAMECEGVPWWRRQLMYASVRMFGGIVREDHQGAAP